MHKWRPDLSNCAYSAAAVAASAGNFGFISLFNSDTLGRYYAVWDIGRGAAFPTTVGLEVLNKQQGAPLGTVNAVVTNQGAPQGSLSGGVFGALPAMNLMNGYTSTGPGWLHDFPIIVLAAGWSLTAWGTTANQAIDVGFWYEAIDAAALMDIAPAPRLTIPKVITLTVESE